MTNTNNSMSITRVLLLTKLGRRLTSLDRISPIMSLLDLRDKRFTYRRRFSTQVLKSSPTSCFKIILERVPTFYFTSSNLFLIKHISKKLDWVVA